MNLTPEDIKTLHYACSELKYLELETIWGTLVVDLLYNCEGKEYSGFLECNVMQGLEKLPEGHRDATQIFSFRDIISLKLYTQSGG
ncbi:MAG: hypothetical protein PHN64_03925 [Desulfovibrionaceae bacterium]|nr:hypothetical protein [Desulfovibrionaceae bacterium]